MLAILFTDLERHVNFAYNHTIDGKAMNHL